MCHRTPGLVNGFSAARAILRMGLATRPSRHPSGDALDASIRECASVLGVDPEPFTQRDFARDGAS